MHRMSQCQHLHHMDHASITTSTMDCDLQVTITMYQNIKHNNDRRKQQQFCGVNNTVGQSLAQQLKRTQTKTDKAI